MNGALPVCLPCRRSRVRVPSAAWKNARPRAVSGPSRLEREAFWASGAEALEVAMGKRGYSARPAQTVTCSSGRPTFVATSHAA